MGFTLLTRHLAFVPPDQPVIGCGRGGHGVYSPGDPGNGDTCKILSWGTGDSGGQPQPL